MQIGVIPTFMAVRCPGLNGPSLHECRDDPYCCPYGLTDQLKYWSAVVVADLTVKVVAVTDVVSMYSPGRSGGCRGHTGYVSLSASQGTPHQQICKKRTSGSTASLYFLCDPLSIIANHALIQQTQLCFVRVCCFAMHTFFLFGRSSHCALL